MEINLMKTIWKKITGPDFMHGFKHDTINRCGNSNSILLQTQILLWVSVEWGGWLRLVLLVATSWWNTMRSFSTLLNICAEKSLAMWLHITGVHWTPVMWIHIANDLVIIHFSVNFWYVPVALKVNDYFIRHLINHPNEIYWHLYHIVIVQEWNHW